MVGWREAQEEDDNVATQKVSADLTTRKKNIYLQKKQSQSGHKRRSQTGSLELCSWYLESEKLE